MSLPTSPDYVADKVSTPDVNGPAQFLLDGEWCGHGEPLFTVYDVRNEGASVFTIHLPATREGKELAPPAVRLASLDGAAAFLVYDPRKHPANLFGLEKYAKLEPRFTEPISCQQCQGKLFRVAIGFEIPSDSSSPNDTSWFALAAICVGCGAAGIVFDDETA
jgi:hypothetical protein